MDSIRAQRRMQRQQQQGQAEISQLRQEVSQLGSQVQERTCNNSLLLNEVRAVSMAVIGQPGQRQAVAGPIATEHDGDYGRNCDVSVWSCETVLKR